MLRLLCFTTLLAACLVAVPAQADARQGPEIRTDDVTRFYALYDATHGKPTGGKNKSLGNPPRLLLDC